MEPIYLVRERLEKEREPMTVEEFITAYVEGTLGKKTKHGSRWSIINWGNMDVLCYTPSDIDETERVAYRMQDGSVLSNANQLKYVGRQFAWGHESYRSRNGPTDAQIWLEKAGAVPLPFTLFTETGMDVRDFSWVVKPTAENVKVLRSGWGSGPDSFENRHFSGACIFTIDKDMYLFDVDRKELKEHQIFNAFITKLPQKVKSIQEAYEILVPDEVNKAIADGVEVQRQGEFFFIKYSDECPIKPNLTAEEKVILRNPPSRFGYGLEVTRRMSFVSDDRDPYGNKEPLDTPEKKEFQKAALKYKKIADKYSDATARSGELGKSATGSHSVEKYIKDGETVFASGKVKQNRREHGDLMLTGWYKVVANTGTISWTIRGDID